MAAEAASAREKHREAESLRLLEHLQGQLAAVAASAEALRPDASGGAEGGESVETRRALASVEGRLQLEQERHAQQLERLQFENEELRRATRAKTEKLEKLKQEAERLGKGSFAFAFFMDRQKEERERGVTISYAFSACSVRSSTCLKLSLKKAYFA